MPPQFNEINDHTGFANGDLFCSEEEVFRYFTPDAQKEIFGRDAVLDAELLRSWAEIVVRNRWHTVFISPY
jgi:hypothetical protein